MSLRILGPWLLAGLPAMAEPVTVAALGDSLTQGYGLEQGDGLVPQLESWLRERGAAVTLVNAGVSGDTTAGGLSRVEWTLAPDVDGLLVALGGNDMLRGIDPAVTRANLAGILEAAAALTPSDRRCWPSWPNSAPARKAARQSERSAPAAARTTIDHPRGGASPGVDPDKIVIEA